MGSVEVTIYGRVQGVLFRDYAQRNAKAFELKGFVRNNKDGTVSLYAEGEKGNLDKYLGVIKEGSGLSRVEKVDVSWGEAKGEYSDFVISYAD